MSLHQSPDDPPLSEEDVVRQRMDELLPRLLGMPKAEREKQIDTLSSHPRVREGLRELLGDRKRLRDYLEQGDDTSNTLILLEQQFQGDTEDLPTLPMQSWEASTSYGRFSSTPDFIGPYRILKILGQGGMGVVYLAEQTQPVRRKLAIKLVHRSLQDPLSAARFEAERQAMARLSHPNISQIYEAGTTEDGFPYFAMEYVEGAVPVNEYCDAKQLDIEERLRLFQGICRGVQHAHQRGIIHRDLKPSNILVSEEQGEGIAKIIDFGLAKALDQPLTGDGELTLGYFVGTPEYMSPETFAGEAVLGESAGEVSAQQERLPEGRQTGHDTRGDIYSLGIILYELLCGHRPFETKGMNLMTMLHYLSTHDASAPSRRLSSLEEAESDQVARLRKTKVSTLREMLAEELDFIVLKAIAPDREQRYDSVSDFSADLERHLRKEPIEARPSSHTYRFRKFVQRHRGVTVSSFLLVLALIFGTIGTTAGMLKAHQEAEVARQALNEAEGLADFLTDLFRSSEPGNPAQNMTAREILEVGAQKIGEGQGDRLESKARILLTIGDIYLHLALYDQAEDLLKESLDLREESVGTRHPDYAEVLYQLGRLSRLQDRLEESEKLLSQALEIFEEWGSDRRTADTLHFLSRVVRVQGDYSRAEKIQRRCLEMRLRIYGVDHIAVSESLDFLASVQSRRGFNEEARTMFLRSLEIREKHFGENHLQLTGPLRSLAGIHREAGEWDQSLEITERVLSIHEKNYGENHPKFAEALIEMAIHYEDGLPVEQAETYFRRAIEIYDRNSGELIGLSVALNNFGAFYWDLERYQDAEKHYLRSLRIKEGIFEPGHSSLAHSHNNLGLIYWKRKEFERAEASLGYALEVWERKFGPDHSLVAWPLWGLAGVYRDQERFQEAEPLYQRALAIRTATLAPSDLELQKTRSDYAVLLRAMGREEEAVTLEAENEEL